MSLESPPSEEEDAEMREICDKSQLTAGCLCAVNNNKFSYITPLCIFHTLQTNLSQTTEAT